MKYDNYDTFVNALFSKAYDQVKEAYDHKTYTLLDLAEKYDIDILFLKALPQSYTIPLARMVQDGYLKVKESRWVNSCWPHYNKTPQLYKENYKGEQELSGDYQTYDGNADATICIGRKSYYGQKYNSSLVIHIETFKERTSYYDDGDRYNAVYVFVPTGKCKDEELLQKLCMNSIFNKVAQTIVDDYIQKKIDAAEFNV